MSLQIRFVVVTPCEAGRQVGGLRRGGLHEIFGSSMHTVPGNPSAFDPQ